MLPKLFFISLLCSLILITHSYTQCLHHQKTLLLQLKNELEFDSSLSRKLVLWDERDECCKWYGVECDAAGNVISLQLDDDAIYGGIGNSSSLFRLKYLEKLNLAYNNFDFISIPRGIHNLTYLTHLNLSNAGFAGQVPLEISSLRRLISLDISNDYMSLEHPNLEMLVQNLTGLRELYLDAVYISSPMYLDLFANFSSLSTLSLVDCGLKGSFPNIIFHMPTLRNLDLFGNELLSGSIPPFTQTGSLKSIVLGQTNFSGLIPSSINNLKTLSHIDLSHCQFTGSLPANFANLSELIYVDLSYNFFTGSLSSMMFGGLSHLVILDLKGNQLEGPIPSSFFRLSSNLAYLDLSDNNLSVDVSNNNSSTYGLPKLQEVYLVSCNLSGFPNFIKHSDISVLDLSNNRIAGEIPSWIWRKKLLRLDLSFNLLTDLQKPYHIPASLVILNLQSNQLRGKLHLLIQPNIANHTSHLEYLLLANNSFSGSISTSLCSVVYLYVLDLSVNKLSGSIPSCLLGNTRISSVINLGGNKISGCIPNNFSLSCNLQYFDVNNNTLEGKIPRSLQSCKALEFMNVGNNIINDSFPCMLASTLRVLVLHSNKFHGEVRCHNSWPNLQIIDISSNKFSGNLESINFTSWRGIIQGSDTQLGHNEVGSNFWRGADNYKIGVTITMKGQDLELVKIFSYYTAVDFSCNNFRGNIPNAIGDLSSLHLLNLSYNAINGSIPKSFGKLKELESLDLSENQLAGPIPTESFHS